jgi:hypothetical protein
MITAGFIPKVSRTGMGSSTRGSEGIPIESPILAIRLASLKFPYTVDGSLLHRASRLARRMKINNLTSFPLLLGSLFCMFLK